ncbi:MAG: NIL domain-containing protein [Desulfatiglandaceae bacterium]
MKTEKVVLSFPPGTVENPIIFHLIRDYALMVNILRASIDPGKQGRMVVELTGDDHQLSRGANYLERNGVGMEPLTEEIQHLEEQCTSCTACVPVCPTGALDVNRETWRVSHDPDQCVVCLACVDVCPYRAVKARFQ